MSVKSTSKGTRFSGTPFLTGTICALIKSVSVIISGSPFEMIHKMDQNGIIPSMLIWNLFGIVLFFLAGAAAGIIISESTVKKICGAKAASAYKGGLFFITLMFLGILHYPLFFVCEKIFVSLLVSVISVICSVMCAVFWSKLSTLATLIMTSFAFYSLYISFVNGCILISN